MTATPETVPTVQEEKPVETPAVATEEPKKVEEPKKIATSADVFSMFGGGAPKPKREEQDDPNEPKGNKEAGEVRYYCYFCVDYVLIFCCRKRHLNPRTCTLSPLLPSKK